MLIIFGHRQYGQIDAHGGQYAVTRFFHIYFLPIAPDGTMWVTAARNGQVWGHPIRSSLRSIVAGYARVWGPLAVGLGAFALVAGSLVGIPFAVGGAATAAWSWRWRRLRRDRDRLRSDFHLLAYGTRCDPIDMDDAMIHALRAETAARWAAVADGRTPEDIARLGTSELRQAVFAYGVLRLAAAADRHTADAARASSEEVLARYAGKDVLALEGGPYR
jgi:hypothetical protein